MKLVHIADTHLGLSQFNRLDPDSGMNLREKQLYDNFLSAIDRIILEKPDVLVHAGDLFDQVKPKTRAYTTVLEALERLHAAGIPFVVIAGNHSMVKTRYTTSPFQVLVYHPGDITAAYSFRYEHVEIGDCIFHLIPNMLRPEDYRAEYEKVALSGGHANVLVTHGLATSIRDRRLATVAEHELDSTMLSDDFDYIALGHYHRQSRITGKAWYSGSLEYLTYGEISDPKGGLLVDLGHSAGGDSPCVQPLVLPRTPMIDLGTVICEGLHPADISQEVISRVAERKVPPLSMAQVTLDSLSREHGKGPDMRELAAVREQLLDLKIRVRQSGEGQAVPLQQDFHAIDYLKEFSSFIAAQQLGTRQREFIGQCGQEILRRAMDRHREGSG
ncbi:MAG TPA: metallophosphoesterase [Methanoregulaceae archaeon]|nr:MAG: metallophosphoesterase [Methanolinea sp.]HON81461.1 metallophosphoesterase [Methanoregulaceae archaeon]HPD10011.1 metallophosphoesterase [Methanoregulaceae archaeon]HRT15017.1 metallophosphoesterase [Methanoregulaceae archaeon]HRU30588.1 metallophosphoesterase [Methanoregulaceae archaeon]